MKRIILGTMMAATLTLGAGLAMPVGIKGSAADVVRAMPVGRKGGAADVVRARPVTDQNASMPIWERLLLLAETVTWLGGIR